MAEASVSISTIEIHLPILIVEVRRGLEEIPYKLNGPERGTVISNNIAKRVTCVK